MQTEIYKLVENLLSKRNEAMRVGDFVKVNEIKTDLLKLNVRIEDVRNGTQWKVG